ncbi:MAG: glutamate-5-semialdehyde dehydrogenase, partial [Tannerellaceae bacterium]
MKDSDLITVDAMLDRARKASTALLTVGQKAINTILNDVADAAEAAIPFLIEANKKDLDRMDKADPRYDRLLINEARIKAIAADMRNVALLPSPLGHILKETVRPNGLMIQKVSVPFGVIGIIY